MKEYCVSIYVRVTDPAMLHGAAHAQLRKDGIKGDLAYIIGTASDPNVYPCLQSILDPGSMIGADILHSSCEGTYA